MGDLRERLRVAQRVVQVSGRRFGVSLFGSELVGRRLPHDLLRPAAQRPILVSARFVAALRGHCNFAVLVVEVVRFLLGVESVVFQIMGRD